MEPIAALAEKSEQTEQTEQLALQVPELTEAGFLLLPCILWPTHLLQLRLLCSFGTYKSFAQVDGPTFIEGSTDTAAFCLQLCSPTLLGRESRVPTEALEPTPLGSRHSVPSEVGKGKAPSKESEQTDVSATV